MLAIICTFSNEDIYAQNFKAGAFKVNITPKLGTTYTPPPRPFELGGYETWRCSGSYMEQQAEPKFVDRLNKLIQNVNK